MKKEKGITLAELLVASFLLLLLCSSMLAVLKIGLQTFRKESQKAVLKDQAQIISDIIFNELNQGIVNPDPGGTNPATGYKKITPAVLPTCVLYPNANNATGNYIEFNEPNFIAYDLSSVNFNPYNPLYYKKIKYYLTGNVVYREEITYNSNGSVNSSATSEVARMAVGSITLKFTYISPTKFEIQITAASGTNSEVVTNNVYISSS